MHERERLMVGLVKGEETVALRQHGIRKLNDSKPSCAVGFPMISFAGHGRYVLVVIFIS